MAGSKVSSVINEITLNELVPRLRICLKAKRPAFLWAGPGIGKSSIIEQVARKLKGRSVDLRLSQMAPTDIIGFPYIDRETNLMRFAPPAMLPSAEFAAQHKIVLLFLDEMNSAPPAVQAAAYQLVLDRRCGEYVLPDNVVIVAAGNRESDRGVTYRMPSPLSNRFMHFDIKHDFQSWMDWALPAQIQPDVVAYLTTNKQDLYQFDPMSPEKAFPTPRSWEFVSQVLGEAREDEDMTDSIIHDLIGAAVGNGTATKFMAFLKIGAKLPKPADVLSGKVTSIDTKEVSAHYQLIISMLYELTNEWHEHSDATGTYQKVSKREVERRKWHSAKDETEFGKKIDNFFFFSIKNFSLEIGVMAARMALGNHNLACATQLPKLKSWTSVAEKYFKDMKEYFN